MYLRFLNQRQLSPEPGGEGSKEFVPLGDIDAEEEKTSVETPAKPPVDLEKAAADQAAADLKKAEDEAAKALAETAKKATPPVDVSVAEEEPIDEGSFWDDVNKLRGEAIEVDFGDIDPDTPEGALIYEKAVRTDELNKFEQYLETTHPRAFAYLAHILDGGKEEDFFKVAGDPATLPTEAELENSIDIQKDVITRNLKAKGMTDKVISTIIKTAVVDDELEEMSKTALTEEAKKQADAIAAVKTASETSTKERQEQINEMAKYVSDVTATGKLENIIIPEKDRVPFAKAVNESIRYENGKFLMVTELNQENIMQSFKEKFFSFKKGNLDDLIDKAARTANTSRLKRSIPEGGKKPLANGQQHSSTFVSLGDMED